MPARFRNAFTVALAGLLVYAVLASAWGDRFFPAIAFTLTALYLLVWAFSQGPLKGDVLLVPLGAMAIWAWLPRSTECFLWTAYFALAFLSVQLFASPRLRLRFLQFVPWFAAAYGVFVIVQLYGKHPDSEPLIGTFTNRNHLAALMELLLPIAGWEALRTRMPLYWGAVALGLLATVMSASRAGIVLTVVGLAFVILGALRGKRKIEAKPAIASAAAVIVLAAALGGTAWRRFGELESDVEHSTRGLTARASVAMIRESPFRGVGLGRWEANYPRFAERDTGLHIFHADDDLLEFAAEGGLPFAAMFLLLAGVAIRNVWREPWSIGLATVFLHSFTEFPLQKAAVMSWFIVFTAISSMARRQH